MWVICAQDNSTPLYLYWFPDRRYTFTMNREHETPVPADAAWSQVVERGASVALLAGRVWLTFENDAEDHILEAPATFVAPHPGRVAVWAFTAASLAVRPAPQHRLAA